MTGALPSAETVQQVLLDVLRNEGGQWLWEPVWELNARYPRTPVGEKVALVQQAVEELEASGLVELREGDWPTQTTWDLSSAQRTRLHSEDEPWFQPEATDLLVVIRERTD